MSESEDDNPLPFSNFPFPTPAATPTTRRLVLSGKFRLITMGKFSDIMYLIDAESEEETLPRLVDKGKYRAPVDDYEEEDDSDRSPSVSSEYEDPPRQAKSKGKGKAKSAPEKRKRPRVSSPPPVPVDEPAPTLHPMSSDYEPVNIPNRNPLMGDVYRLKTGLTHPLIRDKNPGPVYVVWIDMRKENMVKLHDLAANMKIPATSAGRAAVGILELIPEENPFVLWRNMYGTGEAEDDIIKSCSVSKDDYSPEELARVRKLSKALLGDNEKEGKGNIRFESLRKLEHVKNAKRAYHIGTSNQTIPNIEGPSVNQKTYTRELDDAMELHLELLQVGAVAGLKGLEKIDKKMKEMLQAQGELTNCARLGYWWNVFWTSAQLNVASLTMAEVQARRNAEQGEGEQPRNTAPTGNSRINDLGEFSEPHKDGGDSEAGLTNMTNYTVPHPDVEPEWFTVLDLGIAWRLDEAASILFSGLHYHGGSPAVARPSFDGKRPYTRMTGIMYPSGHELDGDSRVAFVGIDVDTSHNLLSMTPEMRNYKPHTLFQYSLPTSRAGNYTADGLTVMDRRGYLEFFARNCLLLILGCVRQGPPILLPRVDRDMFLRSISIVIDGKRVNAKEWPMGPGWTGEDVHPGTSYEADFDSSFSNLTDVELGELWNTDKRSPIPYGNSLISEQQAKWKSFLSWARSTIPLTVTGNEDEIVNSGQVKPSFRRTIREGVTSRARSGEGNLGPHRPRKKMKKNAARDDNSIVPVLFRALQSEALVFECNLMTEEMASAMQVDPLDLDEFEIDLAELEHVEALANTCTRLDQLSSHHVSQARARRQELLMCNMLLWEKLCGWKADAVGNLFDDPNGGFIKLAWKIEQWLYVRQTSLTLKARDFFPSFASYLSTTLRLRDALYGDDLEGFAIERAEQTVMKWLGVDSGIGSQRAALFTRLMVDAFGVQVLAIEEVWKTSQSLSRRLLGNKDDRIPTPHQVEDKITELVAYVEPVRDDVVKALGEMHELCMNVRPTIETDYFPELCARAITEPPHSLLPPRPDPPPPPPPPPSPPPTAGPSRRPTQPTAGLSHIPARPTAGPSNAATAPGAQVLRSGYRLDIPLAKRWLAQMQLCARLLPRPGQGHSLVPPNRDECTAAEFEYLTRIFESSDKLFPFRDYGRSRARVLDDPNGPLNPQNLRTRAGLFSMTINRSLTHGTEFLAHRDYPVMFTSAQNFRTIQRQAETAERQAATSTWFCDPSAYGQPSGRYVNLSQVEKYWSYFGDSAKTSWLNQRDPKPGFEKVVKILHHTGLTGTGALRAFQITTDYVREGVVSKDNYMQVVSTLGKGAVAGLRRLGLLEGKQRKKKGQEKPEDPPAPSLEELTEAWNAVTDWLRANWMIPPYEWDEVDVEHWLCKISERRLDHKSWDAVEEERAGPS